jgi:hypothetical protein
VIHVPKFNPINRRLTLLLLTLTVLLVTALSGCAKKEPPASLEPLEGDINDLATAFIATLAEEKFDEATSYFDADMLKALPENKLAELWGQLKEQVGAYQNEISRTQDVTDGYDVIMITTQFEKSPLNIRVVFNADKRIAGLFFQPATAASDNLYEIPAYADLTKLTEKDIIVGEGDWALPGTLTLPQGPGPWPMVVLVHGSGPNDRDETIGPNKPFKDLALGLASRGVAVLRYDKRTLTHGQKIMEVISTLTVEEETIEDALLAVALAKQDPVIDPSRIYVLGHSLGGMLAPRIAVQTTDIAGLIILAGAARPMEDLMIEQMTYIAGLDGVISDSEKSNLEEVTRQAARVRDPKLDPNTPSSELLGAPASYWIDLQGYQPQEVAKTLDLKMLILQGERDYQVTMADYALWRTALSGKSGVEFKSFPTLNHLMIEGGGEGLSTPAEYDQPGNVAEEVIDAIVSFIE